MAQALIQAMRAVALDPLGALVAHHVLVAVLEIRVQWLKQKRQRATFSLETSTLVGGRITFLVR